MTNDNAPKKHVPFAMQVLGELYRSIYSKENQMPNPDGVIFRDDITAELIKASASDADIIWAARVSTQGARSLEMVEANAGPSEGLINYLMRSRHGSPFEHSLFTFYIEIPIFVMRELARHRITSFNEASGRYKQLEPVFYNVSSERPLVQTGKTGSYTFERGDGWQYMIAVAEMRKQAAEAYASYKRMLDAGIAREVARDVLPVSIYTYLYMTINARSLMNMLSLRTNHPEARVPSSPLYEIALLGDRLEELFAETMPMTHRAFVANGRVAP